MLLHPTVWLLAVIMFCCQTGSYGLTLWVPTIVKGLSGFTNLEVGLFSALPYIAAAVGMVLIGRSSDRSGERFMHVAIPTAIGAWASSPPGCSIAHSRDDRAHGGRGRRLRHARPFWALPGKFLTGSAAAAGIALINAMGAVGGFIGPFAVGYLKDASGNFESGLFLLAGILLIGSVLTLFLRHSPVAQRLDVAQPPGAIARLDARHPAAERIQDHDDQHPHHVHAG